MPVIYLIGSLRNPAVPELGIYLRTQGFEVFDEWFSAGKIADDSWQEHQTLKGNTYQEALKGYAAKHVFDFDYHHLNRADIGVLVQPAGKSGHLELGYMIGKGKPGFVLFDKPLERWDVMFSFCNDVCFTKEELGLALAKPENQSSKFMLAEATTNSKG